MMWTLQHPDPIHDLLDLRTVLLAHRGLTTEAEVSEFFSPTSPLELPLAAVGIDELVMDQVCERLIQAAHSQQKVVVFGDYDADGVCASAIMWEALHAIGVQVAPFLPEREKHGYGISERVFGDLLAAGQPDLIVTVDNGIVAHGPIQQLMERGIEVIVTDHHQPETDRPLPAPLTLHTTQLCGTTVAWMVARELYRRTNTVWKDPSLDLCAIATLADQVPLLRANRSFAWHGLQALQQTPRVGLQALIKAADLVPGELTSRSVSFGLAPRINAMGRLGHSLEALRLMCTKQPTRAAELAYQLDLTNQRRQNLTGEMLDVARAQASAQKDQTVILVADESFHEGVIGLLAGKLMEELARPVIAASLGPVTGKASARSIRGVNIVELLREVRSELLELGGHPMAAGFSFEVQRLASVRQALQTVAAAQITLSELVPRVEVEAELPLNLVATPLTQLLQEFEPNGQANPTPIFQFSGLKLTRVERIGKEKQHLKFWVADPRQLSTEVVCLWWNHASALSSQDVGQLVELVGRVEAKSFKGRLTIQLLVQEVKVMGS